MSASSASGAFGVSWFRHISKIAMPLTTGYYDTLLKMNNSNSRIQNRRGIFACIALSLLLLASGCGIEGEARWRLKYSGGTSYSGPEPRFEIKDKNTWVGPREDRYGVKQSGSRQTVRISRHCEGDISITYSAASVHIPPVGTELKLWVAPYKDRWVTLEDMAASSTGIMSDNRVSAVFPSTPEIDAVLFTNGDLQVVVTTPDTLVLSVSDIDIRSRDRVPFASTWVQLPGGLDDICNPDVKPEVQPVRKPVEPSPRYPLQPN